MTIVPGWMRFGQGVALVLGILVFPCDCRLASAAEPVTNSLEMKLVEIPAGEFQMGAEEDRDVTLKAFPGTDAKALEGESPRHKVRITNPFFMGQHPVTLGQFRAFLKDADYKIEIERDGKPSWGYTKAGDSMVKLPDWRPWAPGWEIADDHPVVYVSWNDAVAFCDWLSKKENKKYRLPTEAEWEYCCRAGTNTHYSFGNNSAELVRYGNGADATCKAKLGVALNWLLNKNKPADQHVEFPFLAGDDGYAFTSPVGKFRPNAFGLYDMQGNVWQWCADWYDPDYYAHSPVDDPQGPATGKQRVTRGGGFDTAPVELRAANRGSAAPDFRYCCDGFRVVREK